jgi:arginine deiminase
MSRTLRHGYVHIAAFVIACTGGAATPDEIVQVGNFAEWDEPRDVLMHTPGDELFLGILRPAAALFERPFDTQVAADEHRAFVKRLEELGAKVHTVKDTLLAGTLDQAGRPVEGPPLTALREFAREFIRLDTSGLPRSERATQNDYVDKCVVPNLHPRELVKAILLQPTIRLRHTDSNTHFIATYELEPLANLCFLRDQSITTAKGVVISRMNSPQRAVETAVVAFVLRKLGIKPLLEISGRGRLEGGDYLPAGDVAFQGQGLRTNSEAIRQMLEHQVFGARRVVIVKDSWQNQAQMHLDTYFNLLGPGLAVISQDRWRGVDSLGHAVNPDDKMRLTVDVYQLESGRYSKISEGTDFQDYVVQQLGFQLIAVSPTDQLNYAVNFLTVRPLQILGVDGASDAFKLALSANRVSATWMQMPHLTGGYGAAHCCTQVLRRVAVPGT